MRREAQHLCSPSRVFLVFYFLDVRIKSYHVVSRWSRERKIRKYSFKRDDKISWSNRYHPFSVLFYEVQFVYREPEKNANFCGLCFFSTFEIIKLKKFFLRRLPYKIGWASCGLSLLNFFLITRFVIHILTGQQSSNGHWHIFYQH